jgi:hypothetical protein
MPYPTDDYELFEEAIEEIICESYRGKSRWDLDEDDTWQLHEQARRRMQEKLIF